MSVYADLPLKQFLVMTEHNTRWVEEVLTLGQVISRG